MKYKECDMEGQMKYSDSPSNFVENMKRGPTWSRIEIPTIPKYYDGLTAYLKEQGKSGSEITDLMWENLRAICPMCSNWIRDDIIGSLWSVSHFERDRVFMTSYGPISRLLDGRCVNLDCPSKEILLIWKGSEDLNMLIQECLNQTKVDAEKKGCSEIKRYVENLTHPDNFSFVKDVVFSFKLRFEENVNIAHKAAISHTIHGKVSNEEVANILLEAYNYHYYAGREFSSNLWVWVSVMPNLGGLNKRIFFPNGYLHFLNEVMDKSGYSEGNVSVAHWVCLPCKPFGAEEPAIYLTIVLEKNQKERNKFFIQATELLTKEERESRGVVTLG